MTEHKERSKDSIFDIIDDLCDIYHRSDFDNKIDSAFFDLIITLIGLAPLGNIPYDYKSSINAFREISHQERYTFAMTAISSLLESPSSNHALRDTFKKIAFRARPVTDDLGGTVLEQGRLHFGKYRDTQLEPLIFRESVR